MPIAAAIDVHDSPSILGEDEGGPQIGLEQTQCVLQAPERFVRLEDLDRIAAGRRDGLHGGIRLARSANPFTTPVRSRRVHGEIAQVARGPGRTGPVPALAMHDQEDLLDRVFDPVGSHPQPEEEPRHEGGVKAEELLRTYAALVRFCLRCGHRLPALLARTAGILGEKWRAPQSVKNDRPAPGIL